MKKFEDPHFTFVFVYELLFCVSVSIDISIEFTQLWYDSSRLVIKKYIKNKKFFFKALVFLLWLIDFIHFYAAYPDTAVKFTRLIRPGEIL